jgi:RNA polymerase sigma factor (sigma-70 family)
MQFSELKNFKGIVIDDSLIWCRLKNGEKDGLEQIYRKFGSDLFSYGMSIKPNRCFIKDCVQELFVDLWKYRASLNHIENVKVYLFRSLSNKIGKELAKEKRLFREDEFHAFETLFLEESVEDRFIDIQRNESVQKNLNKALEELSIREREVIQLLFFEKQTYEDTSKILGITVDSTYTLAWKAISRLKKVVLVLPFFRFG